MTSYVHILLLAVFAAFFTLALLKLSQLFGPTRPSKQSNAFESGISVEGRLHNYFSVKFYLAALLFLLFNVGIILLFPWAIQQKSAESWGVWFIAGGLCLVLFSVGWVYVVKRGVLEWGSETGPHNR